MRGNSFSDTATRIQPAPSSSPNLAGQYYVSRGAGQFCQYLQYGGTWGKTAQYFRDYAAAERELADTGFDVKKAEGYMPNSGSARSKKRATEERPWSDATFAGFGIGTSAYLRRGRPSSPSRKYRGL